MTCLPFFLATHPKICKKSPKAKSLTLRPHRRCIPFRFRVSKHSTSNWSVNLWANFQNQSRLRLAIASWQRTKCFLARLRLFDPFCFLECCLDAFRSILRDAFRNNGDSILNPSEQVRNVFSPKSNPAILLVSNVSDGVEYPSTTTTINSSPNAVRLMVSVLTVPSISLEFQY